MMPVSAPLCSLVMKYSEPAGKLVVSDGVTVTPLSVNALGVDPWGWVVHWYFGDAPHDAPFGRASTRGARTIDVTVVASITSIDAASAAC